MLTDNLYHYRVETFYYNHDGDTLKVMVDMGMQLFRKITLRAENIDAPELKGDTLEKARASRDAATAWLTGRKLVIKTYADPGSYDRYTAEIFDAETEECFNDYMVDNGFASVYHYKWS